jgi:hypothetical protein
VLNLSEHVIVVRGNRLPRLGQALVKARNAIVRKHSPVIPRGLCAQEQLDKNAWRALASAITIGL